MLAKIKELASADPGLAQRQPFKAALEGDTAYFHETGPKAILELFVRTHSGMSQEAFRDDVQHFLATARHPTLHQRFTAVVYQPMMELLASLRAAGYQT